MPDSGRTDPPLAADEATTLIAFLDFHRDTLRWKTTGLDAAQLDQPLAPSDMTLGGLLKHLAVVENSWFCEVLLGEPLMAPFDTAPWDEDRDWEWHSAAADSPEHLHGLLDEAIDRSRRATARCLDTEGPDAGGLDTLSVGRARGDDERYSLRWILVHMIEEYARHNGHADLIRQSIDGAVGE